MARRPTRRNGASHASTPSEPATERERIIAAFMALLGKQPFERIGLAEVAGRAGVSLSDLRGAFPSTLAMLAAHIKDVDRAVLAGGDADMLEESPRERLFDVLMRRLEALAPHREAVRSLMRSLRCNPGLGLAVNALAIRSQQWMMAAADIGASGPRGIVRAQGLAMLFGRVLQVWVNDEDPGLARTMAALDRELARGERWVGFLDGLCAIPDRLCSLRPRRRMRRRDEGEEPIPA
jgi:AcrR family transcriptional regulator